MSSATLPALADYRDAIIVAATEVAENSLFAFADGCDEAGFVATAIPPAAGGDAWLRAWIQFSGPIAGRFELSLPDSLTRHLGAAFAGAEAADVLDDSQLVDFAGELANMICGTWLTRASRHETFSLTPPRVERRQPERAKAGDAASEQFYLAIDDVPIRMELYWTARPAGEGRSDVR